MRVLGLLAVSVLLLSAVTSAQAASVTAAENVVAAGPPKLSASDTQAFADLVAEERKRVRAWWGPTFEEQIRIKIVEERGPSMALVPAWRGDHGTLQMPLIRVQERNGASLHEIVHIYAPNGNRFLAEALAVYAHDLLGGRPAHPNGGRDIHQMAKPLAAKISLPSVDRIPTPVPLSRSDYKEDDVYIVGGSFVRFLVERDGLEKFRMLYALTPLMPGEQKSGSPERWREVYGKSLEELGQEWQAFLASLPDKS